MADNLARLRVPVVADPEAGDHRGGGHRRAPARRQLRARRPPVRHDEPVPAARCWPLGPGRYRLDGARAAARPGRWAARSTRCGSSGAEVLEEGAAGHLPVTVGGPVLGGAVEVPGDASSQFLSGLLLAGSGDAPGPAGHAHHRAGGPTVRRDDPRDDGGLRRPGRASPATSFSVAPGRVPGHDLRGRARRRRGRVLLRRRRPHRWPGGRGGSAPALAPGGPAAARRARRPWAPTWARRRPDSRSAGRRSSAGGTFDLSAMPDTAPTVAALAPFAVGRGAGHRRRVHPRPRERPHRVDRRRAAPLRRGRRGGGRGLRRPARRRWPRRCSRPTTTTAWRWGSRSWGCGRPASASPIPRWSARPSPSYFRALDQLRIGVGSG